MKSFSSVIVTLLLSGVGVSAFAVPASQTRTLPLKLHHDVCHLRSTPGSHENNIAVTSHDSINANDVIPVWRQPAAMATDDFQNANASIPAWVLPAAALLTAVAFFPEIAFAAVGGTPNTAPLPNAFVAYGHYLFILVVTGLLTYERFTIAPGMSKETEKSLVIADASYGVSAALLFVTGYFRAVEYGKGFEFYAHEPIFWLKLSFAGVLAGLSLFPTITFVKRGSKIFQNEEIEPMSEKLAKRMQSILNAELSALLSIPLLATLMARGVGYTDGFPWQAGAALTGLAVIGSSFVYAKQALTWTEDEPSAVMVDE